MTARQAAAPAATVLLVDDEPEILAGYCQVLRREPWRVLTAGDGERALALLRREPVDVVVTDEQMPGMPGTSLLARMRSEFPGVVRIVLTGHASLNTAVRAINLGGAFRFLEKPCPPTLFCNTLHEAVELHSGGGIDIDWNPQVRELLSERERQVAALLAGGQRVAGVADQLHLSRHTVRNHLKSIFAKLRVHSQAELVTRVRRR